MTTNLGKDVSCFLTEQMNVFPPPPSVVLRMASTEFETPHDYDLPRQGGDEMGRHDGNTPRPNKPKPQKPKPVR